MRKDMGFFVEADVPSVYNAYLKALAAEPFERICKGSPYHTISFPLNFSFEYNMSGGSALLCLMPHKNGTAVNICFRTVQDEGTLFEKYTMDLNTKLFEQLNIFPMPATYDIGDFSKPENQVTQPPVIEKAPEITEEVSPVIEAPTVPTVTSFCENCGTPIYEGARFCRDCGTPVTEERICKSCNTPAGEGDLFCENCGARL